MIKIGDFSKLSLVSVRMLRYYEEAGLFKPCQVDAFTGYRYYSVDQLPRLNRILALRDLGLSIEQVARLLEDGLPPAQLRGMLKMKQMEIQQQVEGEQARLARVEARLRQIEEENAMPTYDVILKKTEPFLAASLRKTIPQPQDVSSLFMHLFTDLERRGVHPCGPTGTIWHDSEHKDTDWDVEVLVPVEPPPAGAAESESVRILQLPGEAQMACTIHQGAYEGFPAAYTALMGWIEANGYHIAGPMREFYLVSPSFTPTDPASYITEIQVPVAK